MDKFITAIRGLRKWSILVITLLVTSILLTFQLLTGAQFIELNKAIIIGFMASNAVDFAKKHIMSKEDPKDPPKED